MHGLLVFAIGLALTAGALALLHAIAPRPPRLVEVAVLVGASAVSTVARFVLFRTWVFRPGRTSGDGSLSASARRSVIRASA
jgi:hypothetical protein